MNHTFVFTSPEKVESVSVAGTFNDWNKDANPLVADADGVTWRVCLTLEPGRYLYKYVLNDETWILDPQAECDESDGEQNSILVLEEAAYPTPENPMEGPLSTGDAAGPEWAKNQPIYEVNLDAYGFPAGTALREFEKHLPILKDMGVGLIWLMPLHPRGQERAKEPASPYAVRDFRGVNPDYGTKEDFRNLVKRAHELEMHVLMDWVANHSAWDNPLVQEHPDFYWKDDNGQIVEAEGYSDVAQFAYGKPGEWNQPLWEQMRDDMAYWINEFDIDGFRCDVAGSQGEVPLEFWQWLRPQLEEIRPIFMLAEANEASMHEAFDMTYSWNLTPVLWDICAGRKPASAIDDELRKEGEEFPPGALRMRMLDNHDWHYQDNWGMENGGPVDRNSEMLQVAPLMVLCATLPGKPLVYNGQEMSHGRGEPPQNAEDRCQSPLWDFYHRLLELHRSNVALWEGNFSKIASDHDDKIYAFLRQKDNERVLVVLNLSDQEQKTTLDNSSLPGEYCDWFGDGAVRLDASPNLHLYPWGYQIYVGCTGQ
jgi:glycosidase